MLCFFLPTENPLAVGSEVLPTAGENDNTMDTALVPEDEIKTPDVVSKFHIMFWNITLRRSEDLDIDNKKEVQC